MESREAVDLDFQKLWCIFNRRLLPATAIFTSALVISLGLASLKKISYEAQGKLLVKKTNQASALTGLGEQIGELEGLDVKSSPISTEMEVVRSMPLIEKTVKRLNLRDKNGKLVEAGALDKQIKLRAIPSTDVIEVSFEGKNAKEARAIVDTLMRAYIEHNILTNRTTATAAGEFIGKQLPEVEANVRRAEIALRHFKERNQVVEIDEESKSIVKIVEDIERKITETKTVLEDVNTRVVSLQNKVGMTSQEATNIDTINSASGVQKVLEEYHKLESDLALEQTRFLPTHPTIEDLKSKRETLKELLQQRIKESLGNQQVEAANLQTGKIKQELADSLVKSEVERLAAQSRLDSLYQALSVYKQRIQILPKLEQEQRELKRKLEVAQSTYQTLLKRFQEVEVAENQNMGNALIIEPASVAQQSSAKEKIAIVAIGSLLGILLATVTVVVLEIKDTSIKRLKDVKDKFGYTLLGVIPSLYKKSFKPKNNEWTIPEVIDNTSLPPIAQAYQMLQANLKFLSSDKQLSAIVITSSIPKEGKSTVSANLAAVMAQLGRRVLLIDADMHHSLQHHIWDLTNTVGLSDVIVGQAECSMAIKAAIPNLDVLTAGAMPPNPLALLDSKRMAGLIETFSAQYDFVIIDAPPLVLGADALTLGKITDGILLVSRPGIVTNSSATTAKESLERSGQNVLGLVVNGLVIENEPDSYFYYDKEYSEQKYLKKFTANK
jgi:capsular exopolysaccharide synthesis family protein